MDKRSSASTRLGPEKFADWLTDNSHIDKRFGHVYRYHSRSDAHSKALCEFVAQDLITASDKLRKRLERGHSAYSTNAKVVWPSGHKKTLDLAIGIPDMPTQGAIVVAEADKPEVKFKKVHIATEAKSAMTEHVKAKPRIYDELSNSHQLVHREDDETISCGITVVNIADKFASPLRQTGKKLVFSLHKQPHVSASLIDKIRTVETRTKKGKSGFDANAIIVVSCDNVTAATVWTAPPAPQPGEPDHYETFLLTIVKTYEARFS